MINPNPCRRTDRLDTQSILPSKLAETTEFFGRIAEGRRSAFRSLSAVSAVRSPPRLCARGRQAARVPGSTLCPDARNWTLWEGFPKEFGVLDDLFKLWSCCVTEAGELNAGNTAFEKLTAEFLFESLNGFAQRWLCDIAPSRRPREIQLFAHRKEVGDLAHIHSVLIAQRCCRRSLPWPWGHQRAI
jgi:hypothetical protein